MKLYRITIKKGAEIVHRDSGKTYTMDAQHTTTAERDPNSGCMLFYFGEIYYVAEGYRVLSEREVAE